MPKEASGLTTHILCKHICIAAAMVTMRFDLLPFYVDVPGNELT